MRRTTLLILLALTLTMALGVGPAARPAEAANGCPLYIACMDIIGVGCSCPGFVCNGRFICGTPIVPPR